MGAVSLASTETLPTQGAIDALMEATQAPEPKELEDSTESVSLEIRSFQSWSSIWSPWIRKRNDFDDVFIPVAKDDGFLLWIRLEFTFTHFRQNALGDSSVIVLIFDERTVFEEVEQMIQIGH